MSQVIAFKPTAYPGLSEEPAIAILRKFQIQLILLILCSLAVHFLFFGDYYYTFDDSYVLHVYGRNLAEGHGFSFNPGEISHAATPLLSFVLAAQHFLFGDGALMTGKVVNLLFSLGAGLLLFLIAYRLTNSSVIAFGSAAVWLLSPLESILSAGPQDFAMFTFLILLSLYWYLFHPQSLLTYFFLSLVILARYEGALYAGLMFLNHLMMEHRSKSISGKTIALRILLLSLLPAIWFGYIGTHATLLPTSGSAKLNLWAIRKIPHLLAGLAIFFMFPLVLAAAMLAFSRIMEKSPQLLFLFIWVSFCLCFYGPFLDNRRYYIHLLPFLALFALVSLRSACQKVVPSGKSPAALMSAAVVFSFLVYLCTIPYFYNLTRGNGHANTYEAYKQAGLWIRDHTSESATFASEEIGVIPYFAHRRLVDFSGWLDLQSKQFREKADGMNAPMISYLQTKRPDYIVINTDFVSPPHQELLSGDSRFSLVQKVPLLEHDALLIYSCRW
ncbi:MAG TPA: hypothetical protein VFG11_11430 [Acidobacteriota bacterium]|nr:hypothetical protein [Acidobacteriota bacterium]